MQNQSSLARVYRIDSAMRVRIKVEDDLLKELAIFDAEREENGTNTSFIEIENVDENIEEDKKNNIAQHMVSSNSSSLNSSKTSDVNSNSTKIVNMKSNITEGNGKINIVAN